MERFREVSRRNALKNAIARRRITEASAFFADRSHELLLLKRAAYSVQARNLHALTISDDIDAVVRPMGESPAPADDRYRPKLRPWKFSDRIQATFKRWTCDDLDPTSAVIREFWAMESFWTNSVGLELDNRIHHDIS